MRVHVLGSAAGGGFPQWNCNCRNCSGLRLGSVRASVLNGAPQQGRWDKIELNKTRPLIGMDGKSSGILFEAFAAPGKPPAYLGLHAGPDEATIGLRFIDERSGRSVAYVPGIKQIDSRLEQILRSCDCVLFDGTCWSDDELIAQGAGTKTALAMGHLPIGGPDGSLKNMAKGGGPRRPFIYTNQTHPVLGEE